MTIEWREFVIWICMPFVGVGGLPENRRRDSLYGHECVLIHVSEWPLENKTG